MFGFGMPEFITILFLGLLLFGATKLPEIGSSLGKALRNFRVGVREPTRSVSSQSEIEHTDKN